MSLVKRVVLLPIKYVWILGLILGISLLTEYIGVPGVTAQEVLDCQGELVDNQCAINEIDLCWNLDGYQKEIPRDLHIDQIQDNACVDNFSELESADSGQVLGTSVLAESTGK